MTTARSWSLSGNAKAAATSVTASTLTGTGFPQVGDMVIVGVAIDNASNTSPQINGLSVGGAGAIGTPTYINPTYTSQGTANSNARLVAAYALVTTAFTSASTVTATYDASSGAHAIVAYALTGQGSAGAPSSADVTGTGASVAAPTGTDVVAAFAADESATAIAKVSGTTLINVLANSSGGSATSNVAIYGATVDIGGGAWTTSTLTDGAQLSFTVATAGAGGPALPIIVMPPRRP